MKRIQRQLLVFLATLSSSTFVAQVFEQRLFSEQPSPSLHYSFNTSDGNIVFMGTRVFGQGMRKGHVSKLTNDHHFSWGRSFSMGNIGNKITVVHGYQLPDGGAMFLASMTDSVTPDIYIPGVVIMRTDPLGYPIWVKNVQYEVPNIYMDPKKIVAIDDSNFYVLFKIASNNGLMKMGIDGSLVGTTYFRRESGSHTANPVTMLSTGPDQFMVIGRDSRTWMSAGELAVHGVDGNLNLLWRRSFFQPSEYLTPTHVHQDDDGNVWIAGSHQVGNTPRPLLIKVSTDGILLGSTHYLIEGVTSPQGFISGTTWNGHQLILGNEVYAFPTTPYLLSLDDEGEILTSETYAHSTVHHSYRDLHPQIDHILIMGSSYSTGGGIGTGIILTAVGTSLTMGCSNDEFVFTKADIALQMDTTLYMATENIVITDITDQLITESFELVENEECLTTSFRKNEKDELKLHPNPADRHITISGIEGDCSVLISDATGRRILEMRVSPPQDLDISSLSPGPYLVKIAHQGSERIFKMIIE